MQLSRHFTLNEMEKSSTGIRLGIKNKAGSGEIKNLTDLCYEVLEPVRAKFDKPITITSGYRSESLCEAIGSKKTSQHTKGEACDFEIAGVSNLEVALWLTNNTDFDQCILEYYTGEPSSGWIHVSYKDGSNRKQVLTFDGKNYINGLPEAKWSGGKLTNQENIMPMVRGKKFKYTKAGKKKAKAYKKKKK